MTERRRAWECAYALMSEHMDRLRPRTYGLCRSVLRQGPDRLSPHRARRMQRLYCTLVAARQ